MRCGAGWIGAVTAALLAVLPHDANAMLVITADIGGRIGKYIETYQNARQTGELVVIDGVCLSACTLVLGIIPPGRVCATSRARFGFHAAWMPGDDGRPITSPLGTQALWNIYPSHVRRWINNHGGLSRKMIYLQGSALDGIVASCEQPTQRAQVRSSRRITTGSVRYHSASAANDRR